MYYNYIKRFQHKAYEGLVLGTKIFFILFLLSAIALSGEIRELFKGASGHAPLEKNEK